METIDVSEDEHVEPFKRQGIHGIEQGDEHDRPRTDEIHPDHHRLFLHPIEIDTDERAKNQRRNRLEQSDQRHLEGRPRQFIHEPQQRHLVHAVADLGNDLAGKQKAEIPRPQQIPPGSCPTLSPPCRGQPHTTSSISSEPELVRLSRPWTMIIRGRRASVRVFRTAKNFI